MRVFLADDDPVTLKLLEALLKAFDDVEIVGTANDGDLAAELIPYLAADLVLLDACLPGCSGLDLARQLNGPNRPEIVFVTAFHQFAAEAFELDAADYLLKPVSAARLALAVARARRRMGLSQAQPPTAATVRSQPTYPTSLWVPHRRGALRINVDTIDWVEAAGDYVILHTASRAFMTRATMNSLEASLDPAIMMRVSRSAFVRIGAVTAIERVARRKLLLRLASHATVAVGETYARDVMAAFGLLRPLAAE
ncbi:LytTR family DNA-binding domain-containing protein [Phenylobacterium sp. LjRoot164]|uniref:LytR/AlgR family response regulator transcription factor n=1 Tax=unclassified Phenylobacterium TaxID=2640670 RepID=UPI003ECE1817